MIFKASKSKLIFNINQTKKIKCPKFENNQAFTAEIFGVKIEIQEKGKPIKEKNGIFFGLKE